MDAVSATIVDGGQAICKLTWVAVELYWLRVFFDDWYLAQTKHPRPTPSEEVTRIGLGRSMDPMP